jgi:AICAR transformylase/IMP cyclohydrolase PurH
MCSKPFSFMVQTASYINNYLDADAAWNCVPEFRNHLDADGTHVCLIDVLKTISWRE